MIEPRKVENRSDLISVIQDIDSDCMNPITATMIADSINYDVLKSVVIEYPYVDKDYRSVYYNFYAKRGRRYRAACIRVHFFSALFELNKGILLPDAAEGSYLGFMVLRPTLVNTIGRTIISPALVKGYDGYVLTSEYEANFLGKKLKVRAFPFMMQHTDITVCAHVACWGILRYYSQNFNDYAERRIFDITKSASPINQGGLLPSKGLKLQDARRIFSLNGCFPHTYDKSSNPDLFYEVLYSYVESGIPVFAAMHGKRHAVSVIGHGPVKENVRSYKKNSWGYIESFIVMNDGEMPYKTINKGSHPYSYQDIDAFVVPLPERVYFAAEFVLETTMFLLKDDIRFLDMSFISKPVIRCFLARSSSYKNFIAKQTDIPNEILIPTIELSMPMFIWIAEIRDGTSQSNGRCMARFVLDATANKGERLPFFIIHDHNSVYVHDRADRRELKRIPIKSDMINGGMANFEKNLADESLRCCFDS